jgi:hypothetical protein
MEATLRNRILAMFVLLSPACVAQVPTSGNIFAGYSYLSTDISQNTKGLNGWEGSLEGKLFPVPFLGVVADFSANYGRLNFTAPGAGTCPTTGCPTDINTHIDNLLFGPRVSVSVGKVRPFAEALFGFSHANANGIGSDTSFASGVGGGIDFRLIPLVAWRFQGDFLHSQLYSHTENNARFSTGIVIRF